MRFIAIAVLPALFACGGSSSTTTNPGADASKNCDTNADCENRVNGMAYECVAVDPLYTSGSSHKVCFLKAFACTMPVDCPASKPMCTGADAGMGLCK